MERANPSRAIGAGFLATLGMTILAYLAPNMGMPPMDFAAMLGTFLTGRAAPPGSGVWWLGMIVHFIDGTIIFPLIYAYLLYPVLPGRPWLKGVLWGLILWALSGALAMPVMGLGFFAAGAARRGLVILGSLLAHIVYGAILGSIAGPQATRVAQVREERRAA